MKPTITLVMIVKDEAQNIKACLDSVTGQVDEVVIVDTGSMDNTLEIARRYTEKVYHYPWDGDFSAARNFAIGQASGEWIFYLDADEVLLEGTGSLRDLIRQDAEAEAFLLPLNNGTGYTTGEYNRFYVLRLFVNDHRYRFFGKIHEQVALPDGTVVRTAAGPVIAHKQLPRKERNHKRKRNLTLLKKAVQEDPVNPFLQYYLGVEWMMLGKLGRALPHLRHAYRHLPSQNLLFKSPALRYLIICLQELGHIDEAICLCLEAVLKHPEYTDIYYLGGVLFEEKKEYQLALKWLKEAVRCGAPPVLYSHMYGSGSFLALYHMGYCHERLGQVQAATTCYEQALEANPQYRYPVYSLFAALRKRLNPRGLQAYFAQKGYWGSADIALTVAHLFCDLGYPDLACRCLEVSSRKTVEMVFCQGKYHIYSGRVEQGLSCLDQVPVTSGLYVQAQIHKVMGLFLAGRFFEGRSLAVQLWKNPGARCEAWVLLSLFRFWQKGDLGGCPHTVREQGVIGFGQELLRQLHQYLPALDGPKAPHLFHLVNGLEAIIKATSVESYLDLLQFYRQKVCDLQCLMVYRFGNCGGGYEGLCNG